MQSAVIRWYNSASWAILHHLLINFPDSVHPSRGSFLPFSDLHPMAQMVVGNYYNSTGRFD